MNQVWSDLTDSRECQSVYEYLVQTPALQGFLSAEIPGAIASNSEKRRWLKNRSVEMNGMRVGPDDDLPEQITSLVLFPKGRRRTTLI